MIVIPMAGESSRFSQAGYKKPKFMLDLFGLPVFDYAVSSFRTFFDREQFVFVLRETGGVKEFVEKRLALLGVCNSIVIPLNQATRGQADTVARGVALAGLPLAEPLTIFNIDSFRPNYNISIDDAQADGFLETFHASGTSWSFVIPCPDADATGGLVQRVVEKERVSDECCNGLYRFCTTEIFCDAYARELSNPSQAANEHYVAPIYNQIIAMGGAVRFKHLPKNATYFCGVPAEYEALRSLSPLPSKLLSSVKR